MGNADDAATAVMDHDAEAAPNLGNQRIRAIRSVWVRVARSIEVGRHPLTARTIHSAPVAHFRPFGNVRFAPIAAIGVIAKLRSREDAP
jgi:hypothetical protein